MLNPSNKRGAHQEHVLGKKYGEIFPRHVLGDSF